MTAEATSATGFSLLAQETGKDLIAAWKRIAALEAELEDKERELAELRADRVGEEWA